MLGISIWMHDRIEGFFTIDRSGNLRQTEYAAATWWTQWKNWLTSFLLTFRILVTWDLILRTSYEFS